MSFLGELKRRNVVRVAMLYVVSSWVILQIIGTLGSMLELPGWVGKLAVLGLGLGLPIALGISWAYELTPDGLKRDSSVPPSESQRHDNARRLNVVTLIVAVIAIMTVALDRFLPDGTTHRPAAAVQAGAAEGAAKSSAPAATGAAVLPTTGIAVLPFANMSSDAEQDFFSDGVTEEILNLLANVDGLRVTSRTSSFSFKGQTVDLPTIARKLGVSHVVEGSVRRAGDRVRDAGELIDVASDTHLWSETYERKLDDVFAIQADIAGHIARALKITLGADDLASIGKPPTVDMESWQQFLQARYKLRNRKTAADLDDVLNLVDTAIARDPNFARAHSLRALALLLRPSWEQGQAAFEAQRSNRPAGQETGEREATWSEALDSANRALELDPGLVEPYAVLALHAQAHNLYADAYRNFREAVARAPSDPEIHNWYGGFLLDTGYLQAGWAERQRAGELDPLSPLIAWHVGYSALVMGRPDVIEAYTTKAPRKRLGGPRAGRAGGRRSQRARRSRSRREVVDQGLSEWRGADPDVGQGHEESPRRCRDRADARDSCPVWPPRNCTLCSAGPEPGRGWQPGNDPGHAGPGVAAQGGWQRRTRPVPWGRWDRQRSARRLVDAEVSCNAPGSPVRGNHARHRARRVLAGIRLAGQVQTGGKQPEM